MSRDNTHPASTSYPTPVTDQLEELALAYTRVRGAHSSADQYGEGPPCDWCRLAATQHLEVLDEIERLSGHGESGE